MKLRETALALILCVACSEPPPGAPRPSRSRRQAPAPRRGLWVLAEGTHRTLEDPAKADGLVVGRRSPWARPICSCRSTVPASSWYPSERADPDTLAERWPRSRDEEPLPRLIVRAHAAGPSRARLVQRAVAGAQPRRPAAPAVSGPEAVLVDRQWPQPARLPRSRGARSPIGSTRAWARRASGSTPRHRASIEYIEATLADLVAAAPGLDGLHLDFIRHPMALPLVPGSRFDVGLDFGYGEAAKAAASSRRRDGASRRATTGTPSGASASPRWCGGCARGCPTAGSCRPPCCPWADRAYLTADAGLASPGSRTARSTSPWPWSTRATTVCCATCPTAWPAASAATACGSGSAPGCSSRIPCVRRSRSTWHWRSGASRIALFSYDALVAERPTLTAIALGRAVKLEALDYELPAGSDRAGAGAAARRSRGLLVVDREAEALEELRFADLAERIGPDDLLVVNDTRVVPVKLRGATSERRARRGAAARAAARRVRGVPCCARRPAAPRARAGVRRAFAARGRRGLRRSGQCRLRSARRRRDRGTTPCSSLAGEAPLPPYIARPSPASRTWSTTRPSSRARPGRWPRRPRPCTSHPSWLRRLPIATVTLHVGTGDLPPRCARSASRSTCSTRSTSRSRTRPPDAIARTHARPSAGRVIAVGTTDRARARDDTAGRGGRGLDRPADRARLPLPRGRRAGHELPPASLEPAGPGDGVRRRGSRASRLRARDRRRASASTPTGTRCGSAELRGDSCALRARAARTGSADDAARCARHAGLLPRGHLRRGARPGPRRALARSACRACSRTPTTCTCGRASSWCASSAGLHRFMGWDGPILTDSGGYQLYSLAHLAKRSEDGVRFRSPVDGSERDLTPESADRHPGGARRRPDLHPRRVRGHRPRRARRRRARVREHGAHAALGRALARAARTRDDQLVFGIVQGGGSQALRGESAERTRPISASTPSRSAGSASGDQPEQRARLLEAALAPLPAREAPRYLMGLGEPEDLVAAIARGVDLFDCVVPTRNGRHGVVFTRGRAVSTCATPASATTRTRSIPTATARSARATRAPTCAT